MLFEPYRVNGTCCLFFSTTFPRHPQFLAIKGMSNSRSDEASPRAELDLTCLSQKLYCASQVVEKSSRCRCIYTVGRAFQEQNAPGLPFLGAISGVG